MLLLQLIAQLPAPDSPEAFGWIAMTLGGIAGGAYYIIMCWQALFPRKSPPDHDVWATKVELAKLEKDHKEEMFRMRHDHKEEIDRIEERFTEWITQQDNQHRESMRVWTEWREMTGQWQRSIERAIGHVETKADLALQQKGRNARG